MVWSRTGCIYTWIFKRARHLFFSSCPKCQYHVAKPMDDGGRGDGWSSTGFPPRRFSRLPDYTINSCRCLLMDICSRPNHVFHDLHLWTRLVARFPAGTVGAFYENWNVVNYTSWVFFKPCFFEPVPTVFHQAISIVLSTFRRKFTS